MVFFNNLSYIVFVLQLTECKDDPEYKNDCKDIAATPGFCQEQKEFTEKHCQLSCDWCGEWRKEICFC